MALEVEKERKSKEGAGTGESLYSRAERTKHSDHHIYAGNRREKWLLCGRSQCVGRRNFNMTLICLLEKTKFRHWVLHAEISL